MNRVLRAAVRLAGFTGIIICSLTDFFLALVATGKSSVPMERARWLQKWSRRTLRLLNVSIRCHGSPPESGLLVSNHLSYLDILVHAAHQPLVFVSKSDVRSWPLIGWLTRCAGTLFIRRDKRSDVARLAGEMKRIAESGVVVVIFPEGTSSDGSSVLPFHSSLLAPAVEQNWKVTSARISYVLPGGCAEREVCYWGDMTFAPHLLNLMSRKSIQGEVWFAPSPTTMVDRKEMARELHRQISGLNVSGSDVELTPDRIGKVPEAAKPKSRQQGSP